jgi:phenylpropionate dioxygenase-like ring-hydroxylating dioxygenase large terminal subunit
MKPTQFANYAVNLQSWYPMLRSSALGRRKPLGLEMLGRRLALYRDSQGGAHCLDARCPHLGADLGEGEVKGDLLQCFFHGWCFDSQGACKAAPMQRGIPQRRVHSYPVAERDGVLWIFNGPKPLFELPRPRAGSGRFKFIASNAVKAHPHLVAGNGLDSVHLETMHGARLMEPVSMEQKGPWEMRVRIKARLRQRAWRWLTGIGEAGLDSSFATIGGNLAVFSVYKPVPFDVCFASRPRTPSGCDTFLFFAYHGSFGPDYLKAIALMLYLLPDDEKILNHLDFSPGFTPSDAVFKSLVSQVNAMPVF